MTTTDPPGYAMSFDLTVMLATTLKTLLRWLGSEEIQASDSTRARIEGALIASGARFGLHGQRQNFCAGACRPCLPISRR